MTFLRWENIYLLGTVAILFGFFIYLQERAFFRWIKSHWFLERSITSYLSSIFGYIGFVLLSLVSLDPRLGEIKIEIPAQQQKTILLIDTSTSMLAEDVKPNRLERSILLAKHFARKAFDHQISVMIFADVTKKLVPFTTDRDLIDARIDAIKELRNLNAGTSIEMATAEALRVLGPDVKKVKGNIIVFTDGEDHGGQLRLDLPADVNMVFVGVGTPEGGSIPMRDARGMFYGYKKFRAETVISRLERDYFSKVTEGKENSLFIEASSTNIPSDQIMDFLRKREGEKTSTEGVIKPLGLDIFAITGLILLVLSYVLRWQKSFLDVSLSLYFVALVITTSPLRAQSTQGGEQLEVDEKILNKMELLRKGKLNQAERVNLADQLVKAKRHDLAQQIYRENLDKPNSGNLSSSFNYGTSLLESGKIHEGIKVYDEIERLLPRDNELVKLMENNIRTVLQSKNKQQENENKKEKNNQKSQSQNKGSGQGGGKGSQEKTGDDPGEVKNNPFDTQKKPDQLERMDDANKEDASSDDRSDQDERIDNKTESDKEEKSTEDQPEKPREKSKTSDESEQSNPIMNQLKQDDRRLQLKLLDTATQSNDEVKKRDW
jgi:Ca-activated chloride channel homolog